MTKKHHPNPATTNNPAALPKPPDGISFCTEGYRLAAILEPMIEQHVVGGKRREDLSDEEQRAGVAASSALTEHAKECSGCTRMLGWIYQDSPSASRSKSSRR